MLHRPIETTAVIGHVAHSTHTDGYPTNQELGRVRPTQYLPARDDCTILNTKFQEAGETVARLPKLLLGVIGSIAILAFFFGPIFGAPWRVGRYEVATIVIIYASASAWIIGIRMRRKIKRDLGRKATEADLTSIDTWMEVEEAEERNNEKKPLG